MEESDLLIQPKVNSTQKKKKEKKRKEFLPIAGGIISSVNFGFIVFTLLLTLKLENVIYWDYWLIFSPVLVVLLFLLIITQSRTISSRFPLISRLAWLLEVICLIVFVIMLLLKLDGKYFETVLHYRHLFIPLWILFSISLILGVAALTVAFGFSKTEKRKSKYKTSGIPLLGGIVIFFPFVLLLSFKMEQLENLDYEWGYVFIPLFVTDGFFLCIAAFLLLFTIGSRDSALFTIEQIVYFLCVIPAAIVFEILLVIKLDGSFVPFWCVMIPLFLVEILLLVCGINMRG